MTSRDRKTFRGETQSSIHLELGRLERKHRLEHPANAYMVGRVRERRRLIDLLTTAGRRIAVLVTGHRGTGKTSFVKYCLAVAERRLHTRFLSSNIARVILWDGVALVGLVIGATLFTLAAAELLHDLRLTASIIEKANASATRSFAAKALAWIGLFPFAVITVYPLLYARGLFRAILESYSPATTRATSNIGSWFCTAAVALPVVVALVVNGVNAGVVASWAAFCVMMYIALSYYWGLSNRSNVVGQNIAAACLSLFVFVAGLLFPSFLNNVSVQAPMASGFLLLALAFVYHALRTSTLPRQKNDQKIMYAVEGGWYDVTAIGASVLCALICASEWSRPYSIALLISSLVGGLIGGKVASLRWRRCTSLGIKGWQRTMSVLPCLSHFIVGGVAYVTLHYVYSVSPLLSVALVILPIVCLAGRLTFSELEFSSKKDEAPLSFRKYALSLLFSKALFAAVTGVSLVASAVDRKYAIHRPYVYTAIIALAVIVFHFVEYEWIAKQVVEAEGQKLKKEGGQVGLASVGPSSPDILLGERTLAWSYYRAMLPTITVCINLGFEKIENLRVVDAMLVALRQQVERTFLGWRSMRATTGRVARFLAVAILINITGHKAASTESIRVSEVYRLIEIINGYLDVGYPTAWSYHSWDQRAYCLFLHCNIAQGTGDRRSGKGDGWGYNDWHAHDECRKLLTLKLSHIFWFAVAYVLLVWLQRRLGMFPYRRIIDRITTLHKRLSSRTMGSRRYLRGLRLERVFAVANFERENVESYDTAPVDPRAIEVELLSILEDLHDASRRFPFSESTLISLPEVIVNFVFDELDKLGSRADVLDEDITQSAQQATLDAARRRSVEVHKLFADMKNLLSNASARFIFVGGRDLHDEWLADAVARQPLLTNVFDYEIYLPSLLVEPYGVRTFLESQLEKTFQLKGLWALKANRPHVGLWHADFLEPAFRAKVVDGGEATEATRLAKAKNSFVLNDGRGRWLTSVQRERFLENLIQFISLRSLGRPKKINQIIERLVVPADELQDLVQIRERGVHHYLYFDDTMRFRILLASEVYAEIRRAIGAGNWRRDDRLLISILLIADFLFKFHGRAFSWSNLERVDELANVHRAPDLRTALRKLIAHWTDIYLNRIRNGMYAFRFRSEVAQEIRYISRRSATEEAAFNFTLDESQALKALYRNNIDKMQDSASADAFSALGELYEFDADFDRAVHYYRVALDKLDAGNGSLSKIKRDGDSLVVMLRRTSHEQGLQRGNVVLSWGVPRLRLKLQIGMSFERSHNYERALAEYHECAQLAHALIELALGPENENASSGVGVDVLKHVNLLIQPIFAESWVYEKMHGGVDTSTARVERAVKWFRAHFPFVKETYIPLAMNESDVPHSNFSLVMAEVHNKTADLYFLKGGQRTPFSDKIVASTAGAIERAGYLLQAHYHYCMALHELRRFISYRRRVSGVKYNIYPGTRPTILTGGWPDFALRAAGASLLSVSNNGLARVSFSSIDGGRALSGEPHLSVAKEVKRSYKSFINWMEGAAVGVGKPKGPRVGEKCSFGERGWLFESWLGRRVDRNMQRGCDLKVLKFSVVHNHVDRLRASFYLWAVGARVVIKAGHLHAAAAEFARMADLASWYLWWSAIVSMVEGEDSVISPGQGVKQQWAWVCDFACFAVGQAIEYYCRAWQARRPAKGGPKIGEVYPLDLVVSVLSLLILVPEDGERGEWLRKCYERMSGFKDLGRSAAAREIQGYITLFPYPVMARIKGLVVLLLSYALSSGGGGDKAARDIIRQVDRLSEHLTSAWYPAPLDVGVAYAVYALRFNDKGVVRRRAFDHLDMVEQMCTMRRAYYESISELYYLYDDFSDRQIHSIQCRQMAAMDVVRLLKEALKAHWSEEESSGAGVHSVGSELSG